MPYRSFLIIYIAPAVLAVIGAVAHLPGWYYAILKLLFIADGAFHLWTFTAMMGNPGERRNPCMLLLCVPMLAGILAVVSFSLGGLPKALWTVVDFLYAGAKAFIFWLQWNFRG